MLQVGGSGQRIVSRGFQSGTVERRRIRLQVTGKAVVKVNGAELTDRDLLREMFALFPTRSCMGLPEEAGARDPARRVADDHLRRAGVSGGGAAEDDDCAARITREEHNFKGQFPSQAEFNAY